MAIINTILDVIFPSRCLVCGESGSDLCSSCLSDFPEAERECARWIFPVYDYRHPPVKKSVWLLKYKNKKRLAKVFAEILYPRILEELADLRMFENFKNPVLTPIPLSGKRLRERGFNQTLLICRELLRLDAEKNFKLEKNVLIKPKDIEHQARIENRAKRLKNIVGSFAIKDAEVIQGKNIILIDDVTTTGATLAEARKMLRQAGARKVIAFTVAH